MLRSRLADIANTAYPDGMIAQVYEAIHSGGNPDNCGDTLATFIVRELHDTFDINGTDKDQLKEAIRVMEKAAMELVEVKNAFIKVFNALPSDAEVRRRADGTPVPSKKEYDLLDALHSVIEHPKEFGELECWETMVLRMQAKARKAIERYDKGE